MAETLIEVQDLTKLFPVGGGIFKRTDSFIHAVDGLSFAIAAGESLSLVGESGCGKTTTGKLMVRLYEPTNGRILLRNNDASGAMEADAPAASLHAGFDFGRACT